MLVRMTRRNAILKMVNPIQVWGEMVLLTSRDEGMPFRMGTMRGRWSD